MGLKSDEIDIQRLILENFQLIASALNKIAKKLSDDEVNQYFRAIAVKNAELTKLHERLNKLRYT